MGWATDLVSSAPQRGDMLHNLSLFKSVNACSHLSGHCPQGKEDFERQQKELLEKENIIKQNQVQLGQEQVSWLFIHTHTEPVAWVILYNPGDVS